MVSKKKKGVDAFGAMLLAQLESGEKLSELIEREDGFIDTGTGAGYYISEYRNWPAAEKKAIALARGRVLDIGCGAGRHSLYLQEKGLEVTAIDISPGAVKVSKKRGVKKALVRSITELTQFKAGSFDTVLMMGNNFGLFGDPAEARKLLRDLDRVTSDGGQIIAGSRDPYTTTNPSHLRYHRFNRKRGRMAGQLTIRVRFRELMGDWFDYLLASPEEVEELLSGSPWRVTKVVGNKTDNYFAIIEKVHPAGSGQPSSSARRTRPSARASKATPTAPSLAKGGEGRRTARN